MSARATAIARRNVLDMATNNGLYVTVIIMSLIFIAGYMAYLVLLLNSQPQHTVLLPPGEPGALTSEVYRSWQYWLLHFAPAFKGLFVIFLLLSIAWGNRNNFCSILFFVLMFVVLAADGISYAAIGISAARCNADGQKNNPCNDDLWCCLHGKEGYEESGCPGDPLSFPDGGCNAPIDMRPDIAGSVTQDQLKWDNDFKWLFHAGWAFLALMTLFLLMALTTLCWEAAEPRPDYMRDTFTVLGGYAVADEGYPVSPLYTGQAMRSSTNPVVPNTLHFRGNRDKLL